MQPDLAQAGARLGGVGGATIAAVATPYTEEFLRRVLAEFKPEVQRRAARMLVSTAEATEREPGELAGLISGSERTRLLTATAMAAVAGTAWPPKVYALGRALAAGLIATDDAEINMADLVIPAMADMERPHISLLELLVQWVPVEAAQMPTTMQAAEDQNSYSAWGIWSIGERIWTAHQIETVRPPLCVALTSLIGTLQRHGLADQNDATPHLLEQFSKEFHRATVRLGSTAQRSGTVLYCPRRFRNLV